MKFVLKYFIKASRKDPALVTAGETLIRILETVVSGRKMEICPRHT